MSKIQNRWRNSRKISNVQHYFWFSTLEHENRKKGMIQSMVVRCNIQQPKISTAFMESSIDFRFQIISLTSSKRFIEIHVCISEHKCASTPALLSNIENTILKQFKVLYFNICTKARKSCFQVPLPLSPSECIWCGRYAHTHTCKC